MSRIVRSTLAEQAYTDLKDRIVSGRLQAGQRLVPDELAETLAISPTPIKEALVRLEHDGLVAGETRRGVTVRRFTPADVVDLYEARVVVEVHALSRGFAQGAADAAFASDLEAIQARLVAARMLATQEGLTNALALDRAFHARIVALAANRTMAEWHERMLTQTHTVRVYSLESYPLARLSAEHAAIIAAVRENDARGARAALERHLTLSRAELLDRLQSAETGRGP